MFSHFSFPFMSSVPGHAASLCLFSFCQQSSDHESSLSKSYQRWPDSPAARELLQRDLKRLKEGFLCTTMTTRLITTRGMITRKKDSKKYSDGGQSKMVC